MRAVVQRVTSASVTVDHRCTLTDINGAMLVVSQFTLYGDCRKGKRPSWSDAAKPQVAEELYDQFIEKVKRTGITVASGVFQAEMLVEINNDGPVTLLIDSTKSF